MEAESRIRRHLRSNVVGYVAVFIALSGTAYAIDGPLAGQNTVGAADIIDGEVSAADLRTNAVRTAHIQEGAVKSQDVLDNALTADDLASNSVRSQEIKEPLALGGAFDDLGDPNPAPGQTLEVANAGGGAAIRVTDAGNYGIAVAAAGADGLRIGETGDDGIQIGSDPDYPNYGVYTPSPGVPFYGLWPNTSDASGDYALFTVDNIEAGNVGASSFTVLAKATGPEPLRAGEIVAPTGVSEPFPGGTSPLATVRRAGATDAPIGVVSERIVLDRGPGKEDVGMRSARGPAHDGNYVALTTLGVAEVRVAAGSGIGAGERLASAAGAARALRTATVDGLEVAEQAPTIGVALAEPDPDTGTVPVFVGPG